MTAMGCSAVIEIIQYVATLGWCELDDVVSNTLGAGIGFAVWKVGKKMIDNHKNNKKLRE